MSSEGLVNRDEILPLMGKGIRQGDWFMAHCPAHPDGSKHGGKGGQSLGLSSKGVLRCFNGCPFEDVMKALRARGGAGTSPARQQAQRNVQERARAGEGEGFEVKRVYEYRDASGQLVGVKARLERPNPDAAKGYDKKFQWRHPDHDYRDGISRYGLKVEDMPLWGIDTLGDEPADRRVWFVEGEACVEALRARNELATCGAWGGSQRSFGEGAFEPLRGRQVILWPDNDKTGREYMAEIRRQLRGIARGVVVVNAPVPPAGDAVDYFRAGGTIERLLEGTVLTPTVDVFGDNHLGVRIPTDRGVVSFEFREMYRSRGNLECDLTIRALSPAMEPEPLWQRINLLSASARETLLRGLKAHFGSEIEPGWAPIVATAYGRCRDVFESISPVELMAGDLAVRPARFVVEGLVVEGGGTILFGSPAAGKSQTAMLMAVSVHHGIEELYGIPRRRPTLYVNLERSADSMRGRLARVNRALGLPIESPIFFLNERGKPLGDLIERIRDVIRRQGVEFVVLDSLSRAGYGDLNDNRTANAAVDALNSLGVAWLAIAHTPRGDSTHVYGSVHQEAGADVMVNASSVKDIDGSVGIGLAVTKANDFRGGPQRLFRYAFSPDGDGLVSASRAYQEDYPDIEDQTPRSAKERIVAYLGATPGGATAETIAEDLGLKVGTVRQAISRDRSEFLELAAPRGKTLYALRAPGEGPDEPKYTWDGDDAHCRDCGLPTVIYSPGGNPMCGAHAQRHHPALYAAALGKEHTG